MVLDEQNHLTPDEYSLSLFGSFSLEKSGIAIPVTGIAERVVAYVALNGETNRRVLAGRLWPDTTEARARASLRNALWTICSRAPNLLSDSPGVVQLSPMVRVDVARFRLTAREICKGFQPIQDMPLEEVLVSKELLPAMSDDWLEFEREKCRQLRLHALEAASASLMKAGAYAVALDAALAAVAEEPLRESANAAVISVHLRENNMIEAIRHYEHFRTQILSELGITPSTAMQALFPRQCRIAKG